MRKYLLNLHLYLGLLCAPYLVIFGLSSLQFNHRFSFQKGPSGSREWQAPLQVRPMKDDETLATAVRDSLGLMGWTIPWNMKRDGAGDLQFDLERPGKSYTIHTHTSEGLVRVQERRKGFWQVFNSLHALGAVPNSKFVRLWGFYTELCTAFVLFAAASGIYLWVNSKRERWAGLWTLATAIAVSAVLMCLVVTRG